MNATTLGALVLFFFAVGCVSPDRNRHGFEQWEALGVPLESDEAKIGLATVEYVSETLLKDALGVRFVPLTEVDIERVQANFRHELRPLTKAKFSKKKGIVDQITGERGVAIIVRRVLINDSAARIEGGFMRTTLYYYDFHLRKVGHEWRVTDVDPIDIGVF
jgi:hypothetical protein